VLLGYHFTVLATVGVCIIRARGRERIVTLTANLHLVGRIMLPRANRKKSSIHATLFADSVFSCSDGCSNYAKPVTCLQIILPFRLGFSRSTRSHHPHREAQRAVKSQFQSWQPRRKRHGWLSSNLNGTVLPRPHPLRHRRRN
jgi:hypothetical protein